MDYDIEREKRKTEELHKAFRAIFPLASDNDLPSSASQISAFLKGRIEFEVEKATSQFTSRVVRILCEVSPPKTHVEDMARIVVNQAKESLSFKEKADKLALALFDLDKEISILKENLRKQNFYPTNLKGLIEAASHLLQASVGPADQEGCDSWKETRKKWFDTLEKELG